MSTSNDNGEMKTLPSLDMTPHGHSWSLHSIRETSLKKYGRTVFLQSMLHLDVLADANSSSVIVFMPDTEMISMSSMLNSDLSLSRASCSDSAISCAT